MKRTSEKSVSIAYLSQSQGPTTIIKSYLQGLQADKRVINPPGNTSIRKAELENSKQGIIKQ